MKSAANQALKIYSKKCKPLFFLLIKLVTTGARKSINKKRPKTKSVEYSRDQSRKKSPEFRNMLPPVKTLNSGIPSLFPLILH